jgi:hypothetical protein
MVACRPLQSLTKTEIPVRRPSARIRGDGIVRAMPADETNRRLERRGPFVSRLFRIPGKGGWTFAPIPAELAPPATRPWGRTPVHAVVDGASWDTSIWRDRKSNRSLLAVPARVRGRKKPGDHVTVAFSFDPEIDE